MEEDGEVVAILPSARFLKDPEIKPIPEGIIGSRIVSFGTLPDADVEGGGLVIEYVPEAQSIIRRVVLGFNELGMWIEPEPAKLRRD